MAYTSLLQSDFNESLGLGCEVLLDDNCTADLNNNKSVDQEETIEISDYVAVISTNEYMDSEPARSTHDLSNIHVDVLISTGEHSNIEPSPSTEAKEVHCDVCNKTFSTKANLKRHIRRHNGSMLECSECRHKSMHEGTKPHSCDKCGAKFTNKACIQLRCKSEGIKL
ncbi:Hypothetical predicted protein [Mytilus galloprovincialis]|uniref:C2H2-type domain-containing protein n=1 Tax=Mytilus galloprovincialis TaxID=29158 RepID=A0A8B6CZ52_MYTGA|nr:Hypothetical predicted protein [Mytilus galloprovincialis]